MVLLCFHSYLAGKLVKSSELLKLRDLDATLIKLDARRINHSEPHQQVAAPLHARRIQHTPMRVASVVMRVASRVSRADNKGPIRAQNWKTRFEKSINRPPLPPEREFRIWRFKTSRIGVLIKKERKEGRSLLDSVSSWSYLLSHLLSFLLWCLSRSFFVSRVDVV